MYSYAMPFQGQDNGVTKMINADMHIHACTFLYANNNYTPERWRHSPLHYCCGCK